LVGDQAVPDHLAHFLPAAAVQVAKYKPQFICLLTLL
jgi:hypothetical protein